MRHWFNYINRVADWLVVGRDVPAPETSSQSDGTSTPGNALRLVSEVATDSEELFFVRRATDGKLRHGPNGTRELAYRYIGRV